MEELAGQIAREYDAVNSNIRELEILPGEIEELEGVVEGLRQEIREKEGEEEDGMVGNEGQDEMMNLGLDETKRLIEEQRAKDEELRQEIEELEQELERKTRESEKAVKEVEELEGRRNEVTRAVREMQRRKEEGGRDTLEEQARWYKNSSIVLEEFLGIKG